MLSLLLSLKRGRESNLKTRFYLKQYFSMSSGGFKCVQLLILEQILSGF